MMQYKKRYGDGRKRDWKVIAAAHTIRGLSLDRHHGASMNRDPLVAAVSSPFRHYINGAWETGATTGLSLNPSDLDELVGEYVRADARQTDAAIDAASAAFREWSLAPVQRRADALDAIGTEILTRKAGSRAKRFSDRSPSCFPPTITNTRCISRTTRRSACARASARSR